MSDELRIIFELVVEPDGTRRVSAEVHLPTGEGSEGANLEGAEDWAHLDALIQSMVRSVGGIALVDLPDSADRDRLNRRDSLYAEAVRGDNA